MENPDLKGTAVVNAVVGGALETPWEALGSLWRTLGSLWDALEGLGDALGGLLGRSNFLKLIKLE